MLRMLSASALKDRLPKFLPELQIRVMQLTREGSPTPELRPTSGEVITQFQSDSSRTDSPVRILHAQPGSAASSGVWESRQAAVSRAIPALPFRLPQKNQSLTKPTRPSSRLVAAYGLSHSECVPHVPHSRG